MPCPAPRCWRTPPRAWRTVCDVPDGVTSFAMHGDTIYLCTHKDAPRYRVVTASLAAPGLATVTEVVPQGAGVPRSRTSRSRVATCCSRRWMLVLKRLCRVPLAGGAVRLSPLPLDGTIHDVVTDGVGSTALIHDGLVDGIARASTTSTPTVPAATRQCGTPGGSLPRRLTSAPLRCRKWRPAPPTGTLVPLSIVHRRGLSRDGQNPTLLEGYGSYGFSIPPSADGAGLAGTRRGVGHEPSGQGAGNATEWHEAGRKLTKGKTIDDFIACAEYLIAQGYTHPRRLGGGRNSAGGIPSGGALVRRPDLWAAMVMRVALTNMLRIETTENGPPNVPELAAWPPRTASAGYLSWTPTAGCRMGSPTLHAC